MNGLLKNKSQRACNNKINVLLMAPTSSLLSRALLECCPVYTLQSSGVEYILQHEQGVGLRDYLQETLNPGEKIKLLIIRKVTQVQAMYYLLCYYFKSTILSYFSTLLNFHQFLLLVLILSILIYIVKAECRCISKTGACREQLSIVRFINLFCYNYIPISSLYIPTKHLLPQNRKKHLCSSA